MATVVNPQIDGATRIYVGMAIAWAVAKGWIPGNIAPDAVLFLSAIVLSLWSIIANRLTGLIEAITQSPDVVAVVLDDPHAARKDPNPKVVAVGDPIVVDPFSPMGAKK